MISALLKLFRGDQQIAPEAEPEDPYKSLGKRRSYALYCLMADSAKSPTYFAPPSDDADTIALFGAYTNSVQHHLLSEESDEYWWYRAMAGALRIFCGEIDGVDLVLDNLPPVQPGTEGARGPCMHVPSATLIAFLPLPEGFTDDHKLIAGSDDEAKVRGWLSQNRSRLSWRKEMDRFVLSGDS